MHILFFISSLAGGGAERVTTNLANYWALRGWRITIVTLAPTGADTYPLDPRIQRLSLNIYGPSHNKLEAIRRNLKILRRLRATLQREAPQVAVGMMADNAAILALSAAGLKETRTIGALRIDPKFHTGIRSIYHSKTFGLLSTVVAQTSEMAAWAKKTTYARQVDVIPNPVIWPLPRTEPFLFPSDVCQANRKLLLAVGRLTSQKGFDLLIEAFSSVAARHPDWDLVILGVGQMRSDLLMLAARKGLQERLFLPGWAGNLPDWYARTDLFVMSSRTEGFPNALLEAMAYGLPAVSFDCDYGPSELIRHRENGLLVPTGDVAGLASSLDTLMCDAELRTQFGLNAKQRRDDFSIETIAAQWERLFITLCESPSRTAVKTEMAA